MTTKKTLSKKTKTKVDCINFNNVRISKTNKQIIESNIRNYIVKSIETDTQYSSYFELKDKVTQYITDKVNELMSPQNIECLGLFDIGLCKLDKHNPCMIVRFDNYVHDGDIPYNIRIGYIGDINALDSSRIKLNVCVDKVFDYNIKIFEIITKKYLDDECKKNIQMLLRQHYDIFCELESVLEEYKERVFKFKKGNTLLKKYPKYKKFLTRLEETPPKEESTKSLIDQFESCNNK